MLGNLSALPADGYGYGWAMRLRFRATPLALLIACALCACGSSSNTSSTASASASASTATAPSPTAAASTSTTSSPPTRQIGFEGVPLEAGPRIAPAGSTQTATIDGIRCGATEQLAYHIHVHLALYANGGPYSLPAGIGIPGSVAQPTPQGPEAAGGRCIYWLHTHTSDGIIHVESPTQRIYSLGNFFDEWHQPLSADRLGSVKGKVVAFINGKPWTKSLRAIPLIPHAVIQLSIGRPVPPPTAVNWSQTGL